MFKKYYAGGRIRNDRLSGIRKCYYRTTSYSTHCGCHTHIKPLSNEIASFGGLYNSCQKEQPLARIRTAWEQKIDELVYQLYGLDDAEITMVEDAVKSWR